VEVDGRLADRWSPRPDSEEFAMELSPKERADFDHIVARLRLEDANTGMIQSRRRPTAMLLSVLVAAVVFGCGVVLAARSPDVFGALLIAVSVLGCLGLAWRACVRPR
jgi:hypothetical protein